MPSDDNACKNERNWEIFQRYSRGGTSYRKIANEYGLGPERVRQIINRIERSLNLPHGWGMGYDGKGPRSLKK